MRLFSWFNSPDQVENVLIGVAVIGAIIELFVAVMAVINVHKKLEHERKEKLEKYLEIGACIAAIFFFAEAILGWRASVLLNNELSETKGKVNELEQQVLPRRLTGAQKSELSSFLRNSPKTTFMVRF